MKQGKPTNVVYENIKYRSYSALCKKFNINYSTFMYNIRNGKTIKDILKQLQTTVCFEGESYKSYKELCEHYGVNYNNFMGRLHKNLSIKQCLFEGNYKNAVAVIVDNVEYNNIKDASRIHNKIPYPTIKTRIQNGWTHDEAFGVIERNPSCDGKVYKIYNDVNSNIYIGITSLSVNTRFRQHIYAAKNTKNSKLHRAMNALGEENFHIKIIKRTDSFCELRRLEMVFIKKYDSINNGYNVRFGGGFFADGIGEQCEYSGKKFNSYSALALHLGVNVNTLFARKRKKHVLDKPLYTRASR